MNTPRSTSTSTPSRPPAPPTGLSHSHSLPTIPTTTSPTRHVPSKPSTEHLRSPQTPASSSKNKNFHPYLIQTTASSLLSRTNSSPVQPIYEGGPKHRVSRSMSALNKTEGVPSDGSASDAGSEDRTPGKASPNVRKGMRRSGTLPSFPSVENIKAKAKEAELPTDPKLWSPSELGLYLDQTLRNGGDEGSGPSLPPLLIEDIKTWVLRHQVTGKTFLKAPETWTSTSRPPPFLPLLTSISRRLRRASLHSRISISKVKQGGVPDDLGPPSILLEEEDDGPVSDEDLSRPMTGVRRMARALDAIGSSASDASADESPLRPQWTGESQRREGWKRWEAEMKPLRRQNTGSSIGSIDELRLADHPSSQITIIAPRPDALSRSGQAEKEDIDAEEDDVSDEDNGQGGTVKARPGPAEAGPSSASSNGASPPPPYASPDFSSAASHSPSITQVAGTVTPQSRSNAPRSASSSVTPTTDHRMPDAHSPSPSASRIVARQSLGRSASRRLPKSHDAGAESDDEDEQLRTASGRYSTARRVTIRPSKPRLSSIFQETSVSSGDKSDREKELERQVTEMQDRLRELEDKLESVNKAVTAAAPADQAEAVKSTDYFLGRLGVRGDDGLPKTVGELPVYLFLVGFGVGAVVVRVLFSRR